MKRILISLCILALLFSAAAVPAGAEAYLALNGKIPDKTVYSGGWQAAYLQILAQHSGRIRSSESNAIEAYMNGKTLHVPCYPVSLTDLTGDGIPELLFLETSEDETIEDLYIYTGNASKVRCALYVPGVSVLNYDDWLQFTVYKSDDNGEVLVVEYYECETPWLLTFTRNTKNQYTLKTVLTSEIDNSGEGEDAFYKNDKKISENAYLAALYGIRSKQTQIIACLENDYSSYGLELTLDEALAELAGMIAGNTGAVTTVTDPPASDEPIYGLTIDRLSTRKGPGTQYAEGGTYNVKGQYIQVLARAYDKRNGIWWVKCVIPYHGEERILWTGYKRFDHDQLPLESIPIEEGW